MSIRPTPQIKPRGQRNQSSLPAGLFNDALFAIESYGNGYDFHNHQCLELEKTVKSNELFFRTNNATYVELLTPRRNLLGGRLNLIADKVNRLQSVVRLYKALGGCTK